MQCVPLHIIFLCEWLYLIAYASITEKIREMSGKNLPSQLYAITCRIWSAMSRQFVHKIHKNCPTKSWRDVCGKWLNAVLMSKSHSYELLFGSFFYATTAVDFIYKNNARGKKQSEKHKNAEKNHSKSFLWSHISQSCEIYVFICSW